jgi:serine/threonine-protein kinase
MEIDEHALARVGTVLNDKYTLHRLIGCGGMAAVYEASHRNGNRVAIKVLHAELAERDDVRERFLREGYAANKVEHPGAVRVLDDDMTEDGAVFLVMELLEGATLDERAKASGGVLPVREVCLYGHRLLEVLAAAHEKGIVHRDIKPENLFLTSAGSLKVLDFGIARMLEGAETMSATRTGAVIGTPAFMAPEQALGHWSDVDGRSDLWAAGATMFALISGRLVHEAETAQEMMVRAGSTEARSVRAVAQHVPLPIAEVIDRSLSFRKDDRWPDAWTMGSRLEDAYRTSFDASIVGPETVGWQPMTPAALTPRSLSGQVGGPTQTLTNTPPRAALLPSTPPRSLPPPTVPRSVPPSSTMIGLTRERSGPPGSSGMRVLAFAVLGVASVSAGIYAAFRKEAPIEPPAAAPVVTVAPLPTAVMPSPVLAPTLSPVAPDEPSARLAAPPLNAPPTPVATGSAAVEGPLDAAAAAIPERSAPAVGSAAPITVTPRHAPAAATYVHREPRAVPVAPPIVTTSVAPVETSPPAPAPAPSATTDPTFGL